MNENSINVINNDTFNMQVELSNNNNSTSIDFKDSIASMFSVHNVDKYAHENIIPTKISQLENDKGFLIIENEPAFNTSPVKNVTSDKINNWDTAYANNHVHANKILLDNLISNGNGSSFLANDGTYKTVISEDSIIDFGNISSGTITLTKDKFHKVTFSGASTIVLPSGLTSGVHYNCTLLVAMSSIVTIIQPTNVTWTYATLPAMTSTTAKYRLTYETIDGGTTWYGYWTQLGN